MQKVALQHQASPPAQCDKDWKHCVAVEVFNEPLDGEMPPEDLAVQSHQVIPMAYAATFVPPARLARLRERSLTGPLLFQTWHGQMLVAPGLGGCDGVRDRVARWHCCAFRLLSEEVSMWSEFAGYGTAEIAAQSAIAHHPLGSRRPRLKVVASSDCSASCRSILAANHPQSCIFGDIEGLVPPEVLRDIADVAKAKQACGSQPISHLFQNQVFERDLGWVRSGSKLLGVGDLSIPANAKLYDGLPPDEQLRLFDQAVVAVQETPSRLVSRNPDPASIRPQPFCDRSFGLASSPSQLSGGVSSEK